MVFSPLRVVQIRLWADPPDRAHFMEALGTHLCSAAVTWFIALAEEALQPPDTITAAMSGQQGAECVAGR